MSGTDVTIELHVTFREGLDPSVIDLVAERLFDFHAADIHDLAPEIETVNGYDVR